MQDLRRELLTAYGGALRWDLYRYTKWMDSCQLNMQSWMVLHIVLQLMC